MQPVSFVAQATICLQLMHHSVIGISEEGDEQINARAPLCL